MSEKPSFFFDQFVPGFDFLKNLSVGAASSSPGQGMPGTAGVPGLSNWVAPTLSVEEVEKRIQEMKAVQFWLEQNLHALKATVQALEVQKMTLSTLKGMNLRMEDLAQAFAAGAPRARAQATSEPPAAPAPQAAPASAPSDAGPATSKSGGIVDPMMLWGALAEQFQQIASTALKDAAQLKMPAMAGAPAARAPATRKAKPKPSAPAARKTAPKKARAPAGRRQVL